MTPKTLSVIHLKVGLSCCKLLLGIKLLPYMTTPDLPSYLTRALMTVYDFLVVVVAHIFLQLLLVAYGDTSKKTD